MEETEECVPVIVEGVWSAAQTKTVKNKLQLYFHSKKKSGGGECRVEAEEGAPRAAVYFRGEDVRERVLARKNHEITVDNQAVTLRLSSAPSPADDADVSDSATDSKMPESEVEPGDGASAEKQDESIQSFSVVLDNVGSNMSRDLLMMLVETISGLDDSFYSLEIILESNRAVVTFKSPADVEKFLTVSQTSQKLQKRKLTAWKLEEAKSVRVESLPSAVVEDLLELFFEKNWALPENITMVPDEEAAIVTFVDPKVVKNICIKQDYMIGSTPVKVYPYYESLGTALYGKERPTWKMPEPFTEGVHPVICHPSSNSQKLTITGLSAAVSKTKAWILERKLLVIICLLSECIQSFSVVLDNVGSNMSRDLLLMLVETISGLDDSFYSLEIILESNRAVVTFKSPADVEKFLTVSQTSQKLQKHKLTAWKLEETKSVRVESLPSAVVEDLLELFFEKNWALPENITMVPDEEAAIVTFVDPKVVKNICIKQDYMIGSTPVKVYPYYESLGTALYGKERPTWKMPEPFTEGVHPVICHPSSNSQKLTITGLSAAVSKTKAWILERNSPTSDDDVPECIQSFSVVLDNVGSNMSRDLLLMLVETISGLDDSFYSLEIILESNRAVVTFKSPADVEKFLTVSQTSQKLQKHKLTAWKLEETKSVRVESLPSAVIEDLLELFFEKNWALPENITMVPDEEAAIVTFVDPKVVKNICIKQDYMIGSTPVKVYPYYESLGTALYGKERPTWKMPEPFTEGVHPVIWKFLQMKKLSNKINNLMRPYFCSVNMENPEVKLSPIPNFLRQKGLTAQQVDMWKSTAQDAFRQHMSQYTAFECTTNRPAWKAAEKDVRSIVREDAHLVLDASRGVLTVAGKADNVKTFRVSVENIVSKALSQIERQTNGVSEVMDLSPALFYILQQEGIQKATQDISLEMNLSYDKNSQNLTITGFSAEVSKTKAWILERNVGRSKKQIELHSGLLDFLKTVDPMDMSHHLFTSHGISAIFSVESKGVLLLGSSEGALAGAERKINASLTVMMLDVEDQAVLNLPNWVDLNRQLLDTYNSSKKKTVTIQIYPGRQDQITVAGFLNPVKEVSRNLSEFIKCYSRIEERIRLQSAVIEFINKKKTLEWSSIAKDNDVKVNLDPLRQRIYITGARLHVQKAKSCLEELTSSLFSDNLRMNKPGAKKYFQSQENWFQVSIMSEFSCVVMLHPENQEEEEEENYEDENGFIYCKVKTAGGVLVSVSKADICHFGVDAVVNAANEELQHIGGLALAMLKAAGPELQKISNNYVSKNGKLRPSDAIVTSACNLPCKYIVHAVGPRFSDYDKKTAVSRLKLAVRESLRKAVSVNCSTVALPAISSGLFGFPVDLCAETIAEAVREYCDSPESRGSLTEIHLVDNNDNTVRVLAAAFNKEFSDLGPTMTIPPQSGGQSSRASGRYQRGRGRGGQWQSPRGHQFNEKGGQGYQGVRQGYQGGGQGYQGGGQGYQGGGGRGYQRGGQGNQGGGQGYQREEGYQGGGGQGYQGGGEGYLGGEGGYQGGEKGYQGGGRGAGETGAGSEWSLQSNRGGQSPRGHGNHGGPGRMEQTTNEGLKIALLEGNIQDQTTHVIVNTIAENMNLTQGAVSKAILLSAGPGLQAAVKSEAGVSILQYGDVIITDSFNLMCRRVFHVVCPGWDNGGGQAEETLITIIRYCLVEAEKLKMTSLSFPAIGTGNLRFPKDVVSRVLLKEIHNFSSSISPRHMREVAIVVHPSDRQTVDCFTRDFKGQTGQRNFQHEAPEFSHPAGQSFRQSLQSSASFGQVGSPSLGVYQMQMGTLTLEVSSGDITKETCDVIINASNQTFNLQSGVSKAILDSAGMSVQMECAQIVSSPGYQPSSMIVTSAGQLPSRNIIHIVGLSDPVKIKEMVYSVLKICEENKFKSVAFPALGTGQGGANPSLVADAMVDAVVDFVRKKRPKSVQSVKILIFQTFMVMEFHKCMKKREGEGVEEKGFFTKIKDAVSDTFTSLFAGPVDKRTRPGNLDLETEEFEPTEFELCADNQTALVLAKKRIEKLILDEQAEKTIQDQYISQLSQEDMDKLKDLQRNLTVSIRLDKGQKDKEPKIHLEGLTRDVSTAESTIREIIQRVERQENLRSKAKLVSSLVEWQFQHPNGNNVPFDIFTNLKLEEALEKKEKLVNIKINNENYKADVKLSRAISANGHKMVELLRKDLKNHAPLPSNWEDMKGDLIKLFALTAGSKEYKDVEMELTKTGLTITIISIERVQSPTLWQSYQLKKKHMEKKNNHTKNERQLFHGTGADSIDLINKDGFNRSYAGKHAAMYGNGTYFAVDPCYSAQGYARPDTQGHKRMYLARVLVGDFTQGASGMLTPPAKSGNTSDLYDSVTDKKSPPSMFIVFNDTHAYPEYLITFT
ncbi:protein mono-ADP-ribosyltransferase PARP14-like [Labrus mixtus]|uniref:protein mono-ADP-ribosyltransferase PARP14-like n=1 Tax=Labrus mixtus TaxID=508554 RepID=UPI0029BFB430|nr:protein mono-ADP-ribosyltransferase PARP14-like [Labrus mixtus]